MVKHRIAAGKYRNFHSHDILTDGVSWCDVDFLGRDKFTFWNATLETTAYSRHAKIDSAAFNQAYDALTPEEHALRPKWTFKPVAGKPGFSEIVFGKEPAFEKFEGRTFQEQVRHLEGVLDFPVFESIEVDRSYRFGIGLHATIDAPLLTVEIIESFVDMFVEQDRENIYEHGASWTSDRPAKYADAKVYESNSINIDLL